MSAPIGVRATVAGKLDALGGERDVEVSFEYVYEKRPDQKLDLYGIVMTVDGHRVVFENVSNLVAAVRAVGDWTMRR